MHLNVSGTRRLLSNIDTVHSVTKTFPTISHKRPSHGFRPNRSHLRPRDYGTRPILGPSQNIVIFVLETVIVPKSAITMEEASQGAGWVFGRKLKGV